MVRFLDAPFRCTCGSAIPWGTTRFMSSLVLEKRSVALLASSEGQPSHFYAKETQVEER